MTFTNPSIQLLAKMLQYSRPDQSTVEAAWVRSFVAPMAPSSDDFGNYYVAIGPNPRALFSCHTDTVSAYVGSNKLKRVGSKLVLAKPRAGRCLGADDGVGVWLMREMIAAGRPGLYVFHRAEERGGLGSGFIADHNRELLDGVDFAIALDRRGYSDVITHQVGGRTASDAFARQLASKLGRGYAPSDKGVFTDTANYASIVAECTNVSVGYENEHGPRESLDLDHAQRLRDVLVEADFSDLEAHRRPGDYDLPPAELYDFPFEHADRYRTFDESFADLVREFPEAAVSALRGEGWTAADFENFVLRTE